MIRCDDENFLSGCEVRGNVPRRTAYLVPAEYVATTRKRSSSAPHPRKLQRILSTTPLLLFTGLPPTRRPAARQPSALLHPIPLRTPHLHGWYGEPKCASRISSGLGCPTWMTGMSSPHCMCLHF